MELLNIRIEKPLKRRLQDYCQVHERTLSSTVRYALKRLFEEDDKENP